MTPAWIIKTFKAIGCDTARSILDISLEELVRRTDLEEETIDAAVLDSLAVSMENFRVRSFNYLNLFYFYF